MSVGGLADREAFLARHAKKEKDLDPLRDEVKHLESALISSRHAKHLGIVTQPKRRLQLNGDFVTEQSVVTPRSYVRTITSSALSQPLPVRSVDRYLINSDGTSLIAEHARRDEMERTEYTTAAYSRALAALPAKREHQREHVDRLKSRMEDTQNGVTLVHPLAGVAGAGAAAPLPSVGDSVFRDGLLGAIVADGWNKDQALAALVATQRVGTLSAAKEWLRNVLVSGNSSVLANLSPRAKRKEIAQKVLRSSVDSENHSVGEASALASASTNRSMFDKPVDIAATLASPFALVPPQPAARNAHTMPQRRQDEQQRQQTAGSAETLPAPPLAHEAAQDRIKLPPIRGASSIQQRNSSSRPSSSREESSLRLSTSIAESSSKIKLRIRRPDGISIELRHRFAPNDLLSSVFMTFLSEQGEDATFSSNPDAQQKAASIARQVSASSSKWGLVLGSKVWTWNEMDMTTLQDAGIGALGAVFVLRQVGGVARAAKAAERSVLANGAKIQKVRGGQ